LIPTTPSVHVRESLAVYAGDTVAAPAMELVAAFTCRLLLITHNDVCDPPAVIVCPPLPCSMLPTEYTTSPLADAYAELNSIAVPLPVRELYVPSGVVWFTPANVVADATIVASVDVTTTFAAPVVPIDASISR
jgi:hypothetical protein